MNNKPSVVIQLDEGKTNFAPGTQAKGNAVITTEVPLRIKRVKVYVLMWGRDIGWAEEMNVDKTELMPGSHSFPFALTLPMGTLPPSIKVELAVKIVRPGLFTRSLRAKVPIQLFVS